MSFPLFAMSAELPFDGKLVSKDVIPLPLTSSDAYDLPGTSSMEGTSLHHCCWIEGVMHALLCNVFLRFFVIDFGLRNADRWPDADSMGLSDADDKRLYTFGAVTMRVLSVRWANRNLVRGWNDVMRPLFLEFRKAMAIYYHKPVAYGTRWQDSLEVIFDALHGVRIFIRHNWSGSLFQHQFYAYGIVPVMRYIDVCVNPVCLSYHKDLITPYSFQFGDMRTGFSAMRVSVDFSGARLEQLVNSNVDEKWKLDDGKRPYRCSDCHEPEMIHSQRLVSLPWMLYIDVVRSSVQRDGELRLQEFELLYNPERMLIGPTADGQSAVYRLVARVRYHQPGHYVTDVRVRGGGEFRNWDFDRKKNLSSADLEKDTNARVHIWQRVA